jgi:hypothetical protein
MQKIQFYLVPNRITVTTDVAGYNTEFRQVYQRQIKLYKGIDNTIELDIRNSDQRKTAVAGYTAELQFFDSEHKVLFTATGTTIGVGLMSVTVLAETIVNLQPQMLKVAAKLVSSSNQLPLYTDSQFGVLGSVEVLNGYNQLRSDIIDEARVFNFEYDKLTFTSEIMTFGSELNEDYNAPELKAINVYFFPKNGDAFSGEVVIEATNDKSTAFGSKWTTVSTYSIPEVYDAEIEYATVIGNYRYIRIVYPKFRPDGTTRTGHLDKVQIKSTYNEYRYVLDGGNA